MQISYLIGLYLLVSSVSCVTHWKITNDGRIESNEDSAFTLMRPYDLAAFILQTQRFDRVNELNTILASREMITKRDSHKNTPVSVAGYQEIFYNSDTDCISAGQQLTKFSFYETHIVPYQTETMLLPNEIRRTNPDDVKMLRKPYCSIVDLPFSMENFDHLESIQGLSNFTMLPDKELAVSHSFDDDEDFHGHLIYKSLMTNRTSWVYFTLASDYFRVKGDYKNSILCFQRAIHYAPKVFKTIPLLSLSNMLHKLHLMNDSLIIIMSSISMAPKNPLLAYYAGNIHVTNGNLHDARKWYRKSFDLDPNFLQAGLKMHAVACHIKLEIHLEEQHVNLQKKLDELNIFQKYSDEWLLLNNKLNQEKSSPSRKKHTRKIYEKYLNNSTSYICYWHSKNSNEISNTICKKQPVQCSLSTIEDQEQLHLLNDSNPRNPRDNLSSKINSITKKYHFKPFECDNITSSDRAIFSVLSTELKQVFNKHMNKRRVFQLKDRVKQKN